MSEVRLVIREAERDWSGTMHGSSADRVIAALSADPVTLEELEAATARFERASPDHRFFANLRQGLCDEPYDAGLVVVDLIARLVVTDSTYSSPGKAGMVEYHDGQSCYGVGLRYNLADDWLLTSDRHVWRHVAEERRRERAAKPILNARAVFYGRPLVEYVARESLAAFSRRPQPASVAPDCEDSDDSIYNTLSGIHAAWLLTPRDDLGGECPRAIALDRHNHISRDLQNRCEYWSLLGECPPALAESSHAFRHGGFGTHELVKHYDLVRELLSSCWERLTEMAESPQAGHRPESLTAGDFLTTEVPRLERVRESWLDAPDEDCHGRTPRSIIDRERARLPEGVTGHEAMVDPDCPCCQMMSDLPGPVFWHLDGCNMDDDFAFDIRHRTRKEWEDEQQEWEAHFRRYEATRSERERLGVTESNPGEDESNAIWSRSYCVGENANVPVGVRVFGLGCRLAEVIAGLRTDADHASASPETQSHIEQLGQRFGNLREVLQNADLSLATALIEPVVDSFADTLATVASTRTDLASQCESLVNELRALLDSSPPTSTEDPYHDGLPF